MAKSVDNYQALWKMIVLCAFVFLLVDANSQTIPYMTFMGQTLPNNSYMVLSLIRDPLSGGAGVQCHTDLTTCCSNDQGMDRGNWYAPGSEDRLPLKDEEDSLHAIYECRGNQSVTLLQRQTAVSQPAGIYRCDIAVSGSGRGTVYIGLYETGGMYITSFFLFTEN